MARGNASKTPVGVSLITLFDAGAGDGVATACGIEADSANTDRVNVIWTLADGTVNNLSVAASGPGAYKVFRAGPRQIQKVQAQAASGTQGIYFDLLAAQLGGK